MAEIEKESRPYIEKINEDLEQRIVTEEDEQKIDTIEDQIESSIESQRQTQIQIRNSNGDSKISKRKKNTQIMQQEAQNVDIQKIKKQINNIEDYRVMAQKVIEAGKETKRLSQKFDRLEREIKQKMSDSHQQYRGNWEHIAMDQPTTSPQKPVYRGQMNQQPGMQQAEIIRTRAEKRNNKGQATQDILHYLQGGLNHGGSQVHQRNKSENHTNGSIFPAVQTHQMKILPPQESNKNGRNKSSINATSAAKDKKYESRNSILNVTQYNMGLGLPQTASSNMNNNYEMDLEGNAAVNRRINIGQRANRHQKTSGATNTPLSVSQKADMHLDPRNLQNQNSMIQAPNYLKMFPESCPTGIGNVPQGFSTNQNEQRHTKRQNLAFNKRQTLGLHEQSKFAPVNEAQYNVHVPGSANHSTNKYPEIHQNMQQQIHQQQISTGHSSANQTRYNNFRGQEQINESFQHPNSKLKHQQTFHTPKKQQLLQLDPASASKQSQRTAQHKVPPNNNFQLYIQINHIQMPQQSQTNRQNDMQPPQTQAHAGEQNRVHQRQNARNYADKFQEVVNNRQNINPSNQGSQTGQPNSRKCNKRHIIDTAPYNKKNRHLAQSIDMSSGLKQNNLHIKEPTSPQNNVDRTRNDYCDSNLKRKLTQPQNSVMSDHSLN